MNPSTPTGIAPVKLASLPEYAPTPLTDWWGSMAQPA